MTTTFDTLIERYADDVAYLAAGPDIAPEPTDQLTPEMFAGLIQEAVYELSNHPGLRLHSETDDMSNAMSLLHAALQAPGPARAMLLDQADGLLQAAQSAATELRLAS